MLKKGKSGSLFYDQNSFNGILKNNRKFKTITLENIFDKIISIPTRMTMLIKIQFSKLQFGGFQTI